MAFRRCDEYRSEGQKVSPCALNVTPFYGIEGACLLSPPKDHAAGGDGSNDCCWQAWRC